MPCYTISNPFDPEIISERIIVKGVVQGVGFRPFVYTTARKLGLAGKITNTRAGVEIIIQGSKNALSHFKATLSDNPPKLARITDIKVEPCQFEDFKDFIIEASNEDQNRKTLIPPDAAICELCQSEMGDPENRRFYYPFINCTDCGPRFTIVRDLPFDRRTTSMDSFPMCRDCLEEYEKPVNRRFHAQAICCPICGPDVVLVHGDGKEISGKSAIDAAVTMLEEGKIVAVKGIGGFHLAADATNAEAVSRLRHLKERGDKPFAVMAASMDTIHEFSELSTDEEGVLLSSARPVMILKKRRNVSGSRKIADDVAPNNPLIGVMLAYAPLHFLLFSEKLQILVMTSANKKDYPITYENQDALAVLKSMADAILIHDRDIHIRSDDSVGRWMGDSFRIFRRSRGYVPMPIDIGKHAPDILATGGIMKNTLCMVKGRSAFLSPHIGDLETPAGFDFFHQTATHMSRLFDVNPSVIVHDKHPDYFTSNYGRHFPSAEILTVQHHHAHIVSCMVENGYDGDVIGFAFDGTGYGDDGTIWGGEVLLASRGQYIRSAHLNTVAMPGGSAAVKEPWRMGISWLYHAFGDDMWNLDLPLLRETDTSTAKTLVHMINRKINSPLTSSMGRLFDAVSAIMGLCHVNTFDGQAAMALEMCALDSPENMDGYPVDAIREERGILISDMRPLIRAVVEDIKTRVDPAIISSRFHSTLIRIFTDIGVILSNQTGIHVAALSGGVFQNARLLSGLSKALSEKNITVLTHSIVPTNDGGLSLGQAGIAAAINKIRKNHDI